MRVIYATSMGTIKDSRLSQIVQSNALMANFINDSLQQLVVPDGHDFNEERDELIQEGQQKMLAALAK